MRSGPHKLVDGQASWAYVDGLSITIVAMPRITDDLWRRYLEETHAVGGAAGIQPTVSVTHMLYEVVNATQRGITADFLAKSGMKPIARSVVLTDDRLARGAMTALGWFLPGWTFRAHAPRDWRKGLAWLHELTKFDLDEAEQLLRRSYETVGATLPRAR